MALRNSLVTVVTRAVQRADTPSDVHEEVCAAAVGADHEFACFSGSDGAFVAASRSGVEPPDPEDVVPTYRSASAPAPQTDFDADELGTAVDADELGTNPDTTARSADSGNNAAVTTLERRVTCNARDDGYTVTVPVVDQREYYGTLALGTSERLDDDELERYGVFGTVVGQALARIEVTRERDRLRETLARDRRRFEKLHSIAAGMVGCEDATSIYHLAIDAAENILEFDVCGIDVVEDGSLVPKAVSTGTEPDSFQPIPTDEGVAGATFQENETILVDDVDTHPLADPAKSEYKSVLSVPIEGIGVFQAGANERSAFSLEDAELAELLMAHVSATLQRLRSDAALRENEEKYRTLIEQSHDAIAIYQDGGLTFANQRATELFGRERDALLDADAAGLLVPEDCSKVERIVDELTDETGRQQTFEGRIRRANGDVRFCEFSATSITYDDGVGVLASIRDITDRKRRERDLERQNERLEEFASVVSHDLRSPINVARGSVDLAENTGDMSHLDRAKDALDRMEALVEDVLQLARQGQLVDETEWVPLRDVTADAWRSINAPGATLDVETDAAVEADRTRLQELFENLFRNAVEHGSTSPRSQAHEDAGEHGGDVTITVSSRPNGFAVEDDGPGLPEDSHDEVFERGFTSIDDGTGFGLAIVETVAEAHGWTVEAVPPQSDDESDSVRGALFEVTDCCLK